MKRFTMIACSALLIGVGLIAGAAEVSGRVADPDACRGVRLLLRENEDWNRPWQPKEFVASYDEETGAFEASGLPAGRYDLRLMLAGGRADGADLRVEDADEAEPFTAEDEAAIRELIANTPDAFMDIFRPIAIRGRGDRAKALVELIRARRFHSGEAGEIIWRVEVWSLERHTGAWIRSRGRSQVLCRLRVAPVGQDRRAKANMDTETFRKLTWLFSPELGGIELKEETVLGDIEAAVPEISPESGKTPGSVTEQIKEYRRGEPEPYPE